MFPAYVVGHLSVTVRSTVDPDVALPLCRGLPSYESVHMTTPNDTAPTGDHADSSESRVLRWSLWRNRDFRKLWIGHTVSMFGSQITPVAMPLIAALALQATPTQMALLLSLQYTPATLLGLFAGVWVDRMRRRQVMILSDMARALLLLMLPLTAALGFLRMEVLYVLTFLLGVGGLFFGVADAAFLPALVRRDQLVAANSALATSSSVAQIAGPGLAGVLVQWLSAPFAVVGDALSFLVSAWAAATIRTPEPPPLPLEQRPNMWPAIWEGLRAIVGHPILRAFMLSSLTFDIFWNTLYAVYILYLTRVLGLPPTALGVILGVGSLGALVGALSVEQVTRRLGVGPTVVVAQCIIGSASLLIWFASIWPAAALPLLIAAEVIQSGVNTIYGIIRYSLRQAITSDRLRGRVDASSSFIGLLPAVLGLLVGGVLGERIGITTTIIVGACGGMLGFLWILFSPVRMLHTMPDPTENAQDPL
jgi:MFS family permease